MKACDRDLLQSLHLNRTNYTYSQSSASFLQSEFDREWDARYAAHFGMGPLARDGQHVPDQIGGERDKGTKGRERVIARQGNAKLPQEASNLDLPVLIFIPSGAPNSATRLPRDGRVRGSPLVQCGDAVAGARDIFALASPFVKRVNNGNYNCIIYENICNIK